LVNTWSFCLLSVASTLFVAVCIVWPKSICSAQAIARALYIFSLIVSMVPLLITLLAVSGSLPNNELLASLFRIFVFRGWVVIGVAISSAVLAILITAHPHQSWLAGDATRVFVTSPYVIKGICLSVALAFISTEIGKLAHDADMRQFFLSSGLPVWFLYFIMIAETAGAIGLLVKKTVAPAALGLAVIMVGAIATHAHNHDPFSDSLEALHLLILLCATLLLRLQPVRGPSLVPLSS